MPYVARINVPGYAPTDDDPPIFETATEAWAHLAEERSRDEDANAEGETYSDTRETLAILGEPAQHAYVPQIYGDWGLTADGQGTIYGPTPGYNGEHDLGLAYSVTYTEDDDWVWITDED